MPPENNRIGNGWAYNGSIDNDYSHPGYDEDRNSDWRVQMAQYYMNKACRDMSQRYILNTASKEMYNDVFDQSKSPAFSQTDDGSPRIVEYEYLNNVAKPINVQTGEKATQIYEVHADLINSEAKANVELLKKQLHIDKILKEQFATIEQEYGMAFPDPTAIFDGKGSKLDEFIKTGKGYRDGAAEGAERQLIRWMENENWWETEVQAYRNFRITGDLCFMPYIHPTTFDVKCPLIDTNDIVWDIDMRDDFGRGMHYFVYFDYLSIPAIIEEFPNIDRELINSLVNDRSERYRFCNWSYRNFKKDSSGNLYLMVARCRFIAPRDKYNHSYKDKKGNLIFVEDDSRAKTRAKYEKIVADYHKGKTDLGLGEYRDANGDIAKIDKISYQELYYTTLIGGVIEGEGGVVKNQVRMQDNPSIANMGVFLFVPNYIDQKAISDPMRVQELQSTLNMLWFKFKELIAQAKGMVLSIDFARLPPNPSTGKPDFSYFMTQLQANNIHLYDSSATKPGSFDLDGNTDKKALETADLGVSQSIQWVMEAIPVVEKKIEDIMGISRSRKGDIDRYESVRNAMMNKTQSDYVTAYPNIGFDKIVEKTLSHIANLLKISYVLKKENDIDIGEDLFNYEDYKDLLYVDLGIKIKKRQNTVELKDFIDQIIIFTLQATQQGAQSPLSLMQALKLKTADSINEALEMLEDMLEEHEIAEMQRKIQEAEAQEKMMAQQHQQALEQQAQKEGLQAQRDDRKADRSMQQQLVNSGVNMASQQMGEVPPLSGGE